jgi:hypothetical protein
MDWLAGWSGLGWLGWLVGLHVKEIKAFVVRHFWLLREGFLA